MRITHSAPHLLRSDSMIRHSVGIIHQLLGGRVFHIKDAALVDNPNPSFDETYVSCPILDRLLASSNAIA